MIDCQGETYVTLSIVGKTIKVPCIAIQRMLPGVDVVIETNMLKHFKFCLDYKKFSIAATAVSNEMPNDNLTITKNYFKVNFNKEKWVARWNWIKETVLRNCVDFYKMDKAVYPRFKSEVKRWIDNGWLVKTTCNHHHLKYTCNEKGVIPLMAVVQEKKDKVQPVLNFRELNEFVECRGVDADVCDEKLRSWMQKLANCVLLDLCDAYMLINVADKCSKYETVKFEGNFYKLIRLGFSLNRDPETIKPVISKVLLLDEKISKVIDHCYDNIIIDLNMVSAQVVKKHLLKFGLITKPSENLNSAKVLGLQTYEKKGVVHWRRTELKKEINLSNLNSMTKRQVFSLCGKLVSHYPVAKWLQIACSFVKRSCESNAWDSFAGSVVNQRFRKVLSCLDVDDPVKGIWSASSGKLNIWGDAGQIAYDVALKRKNQIIEDRAWLRKANDGTYINLAELNAVIKGVNLVMKWGARDITIFTDSATIYSWLSSFLKKDKRIRVSELSKMLVK